jgi:plasmid stabilization system protein ParE
MPPDNVDFTKRANRELHRVFVYLAIHALDEQDYADRAAQVIDQLELLAISPLVGIRMKGHPNTFRYWLIVNDRYRVYYERLDSEHITVVHIRGVRQKPLNDEEIERFYK